MSKASDARHLQTIDFVRTLMRGAQETSNFSMREFGDKIGVSAATICRFNQGKLVDIVTFLKFVEFLEAR